MHTIHLLKPRGGNQCGASGPSDADINGVTCTMCIAQHNGVYTDHDIRELAKAALAAEGNDYETARFEDASAAFAKAVESRLTPRQAAALWSATSRERGDDADIVEAALKRINVKPLTREEAALARLENELTVWYGAPEQSNIPEDKKGCAMELIMFAHNPRRWQLTHEQRDWLYSFVRRWDATVEGFRS
jgi:hypothetical protein